jgi:hypothetical protein
MLTYGQIKDKPKTLKCLTGFSPQEFLDILPAFIQEYEIYLEDSQRGKTRRRHQGGGRKSRLKTINDKLLFILFQCRNIKNRQSVVLNSCWFQNYGH